MLSVNFLNIYKCVFPSVDVFHVNTLFPHMKMDVPDVHTDSGDLLDKVVQTGTNKKGKERDCKRCGLNKSQPSWAVKSSCVRPFDQCCGEHVPHFDEAIV